ncbi:hypothetical protein L2E82_08287 [Cichorium intybus]|uniref:Uncharacterized protein n=1 Tax=Cichorium intybus TaxID=13427 RepID=A0ACB9G629_CICIN|nr:hypothetical protein L2E82_08287 [Cichorium intybus]
MDTQMEGMVESTDDEDMFLDSESIPLELQKKSVYVRPPNRDHVTGFRSETELFSLNSVLPKECVDCPTSVCVESLLPDSDLGDVNAEHQKEFDTVSMIVNTPPTSPHVQPYSAIDYTQFPPLPKSASKQSVDVPPKVLSTQLEPPSILGYLLKASSPSSSSPVMIDTQIVNSQPRIDSSDNTNRVSLHLNPSFEDDSPAVIPLENLKAASIPYVNTLVGIFLGKNISFPKANHVLRRRWSKFGLTDIFMNNQNCYFFKFSSD